MSIPKDIVKQVQSLKDEIIHHDYLYYNLDAPEIPDPAYDVLFGKLQELEQQYPALKTPDSPTQRVGTPPPSTALGLLTHDAPMYSETATPNPFPQKHQSVSYELASCH